MHAASNPPARSSPRRPSPGTVPSRDRGSRSSESAVATPGAPAASTPFPEGALLMMDTQRLIALIVFSFTSLLLWDAWQKQHAPKVQAPPSAAVQAGVPAQPAPTAAVPSATPSTATPPAGSTAPATATP